MRLELEKGIPFCLATNFSLQAVDGSERYIEMCPQFVHASRLTFVQRCKAFTRTIVELYLKPRSVYFDDYMSRHLKSVAEVYFMPLMIIRG